MVIYLFSECTDSRFAGLQTLAFVSQLQMTGNLFPKDTTVEVTLFVSFYIITAVIITWSARSHPIKLFSCIY